MIIIINFIDKNSKITKEANITNVQMRIIHTMPCLSVVYC